MFGGGAPGPEIMPSWAEPISLILGINFGLLVANWTRQAREREGKGLTVVDPILRGSATAAISTVVAYQFFRLYGIYRYRLSVGTEAAEPIERALGRS